MRPNIFQPWKEQLRAVIFDMDGVLVLSSAIHADAFAEVLDPLHVNFNYCDYAGMRTRDAIEATVRASGLQISSGELDQLARLKTAAALRRLKSENPLVPFAREVLDWLSRRYLLALATSASVATLEALIDGNSLRPYFRCVLCAADCRQAKPSPEIYLGAASRLQVHPSACLVVEDAIAGIAAAKAAGAVCAAVVGTLPLETLRGSEADLVLSDISDLMEL